MLLIEAGANVNASSEEGVTPLMDATDNKDEDTSVVVHKLIEAGADVNMTTETGVTPLTNAAYFGHEQSLPLLLETGATVNVADDNGITALMKAARNGHMYCLELLIKSGALVNMCNHFGNTAVIKAARKFTFDQGVINKLMDRRLSCLKLLNQAGADVNTINNSDHNALSAHLTEQSDEKVIMLLFAAGTNTDRISKVPCCLQEPGHLELRHICRTSIRNHLLQLDSHLHLFRRIPLLGLPDPLMRYLLYNMSLED